jgi:endonuclease YncB( thermonuclease family)
MRSTACGGGYRADYSNPNTETQSDWRHSMTKSKQHFIGNIVALICALVLIGLLLTPNAFGAQRAVWSGPHGVTVLSIEDGDTVKVQVRGRCPFGCEDINGRQNVIAIRLSGIDAPEIHTCKTKINNSCAACVNELVLAKKAKERVQSLISAPAAVRVVNLSPDKYRGRVVGDLQVFRSGKWRSISALLLEERLVISYEGKTKLKPWCEAKT